MPAVPLRKVARSATLGGLEIPHAQQQSLIVLLTAQRDGTNQGRRFTHAAWSLSTSKLLSLERIPQDLPRQSFLGNSSHVAETS